MDQSIVGGGGGGGGLQPQSPMGSAAYGNYVQVSV